MNSRRGSPLTTAFRKDCMELISRFTKLGDNIRYQEFARIWKEMKFANIFGCFDCYSILLGFCHEALDIAKQLFINCEKFPERVCCFYLLYALYNKIPVPGITIRVTMNDYKSLIEFQQALKDAEHLDAIYILSKMFKDQAFSLCFFDYEYGLEKSLGPQDDNAADDYSTFPILKPNSGAGELLRRVDKLSRHYDTAKSSLLQEGESLNIDMFDTKFAETAIKEIQEFNNQRKSTMQTPISDLQDIGLIKSTKKKSKRSKLNKAINYDTGLSSSESSDENLMIETDSE